MMNSHYLARVATIKLIHVLVVISWCMTRCSMNVFIASLVLSCDGNRLLLDNLVTYKHVWIMISSSKTHVAHPRVPTAANCSLSLVLLARKILLVLISVRNHLLKLRQEAASIQFIIVTLIIDSTARLTHAV